MSCSSWNENNIFHSREALIAWNLCPLRIKKEFNLLQYKGHFFHISCNKKKIQAHYKRQRNWYNLQRARALVIKEEASKYCACTSGMGNVRRVSGSEDAVSETWIKWIERALYPTQLKISGPYYHLYSKSGWKTQECHEVQ